jgi:hypothetical protein
MSCQGIAQKRLPLSQDVSLRQSYRSFCNGPGLWIQNRTMPAVMDCFSSDLRLSLFRVLAFATDLIWNLPCHEVSGDLAAKDGDLMLQDFFAHEMTSLPVQGSNCK